MQNLQNKPTFNWTKLMFLQQISKNIWARVDCIILNEFVE